MNQEEPCRPLGTLDYIGEALTDAESLLKFASEKGKNIDEQTRSAVLHARAAFPAGIDEKVADDLLVSLAKLAAEVSPVTAESLRACHASPRVRRPYQNLAIALGAVAVIYSIISFMASTIAESLRNEITTANAFAVKLNAELVPIPSGMPPALPDSGGASSSSSLPTNLSRADIIKDLQQYAICIRNIDSHTGELSWFTNPVSRRFRPEEVDPFYDIRSSPEKMGAEFELPVPITDFAKAAIDRTRTYQKVRCFAQNTVDGVSFFYGALSSCLLPLLYALLGAAAYLVRSFEQKVRDRTYVPSPATDFARFIVAGIGGAVIGLFANVTGTYGITVRPLALAFLVGYAVDVFYAFLENLIQSFTRTVLTPSAKSATTAAVNTSVQ